MEENINKQCNCKKDFFKVTINYKKEYTYTLEIVKIFDAKDANELNNKIDMYIKSEKIWSHWVKAEIKDIQKL
jgi:hypothetical protein